MDPNHISTTLIGFLAVYITQTTGLMPVVWSLGDPCQQLCCTALHKAADKPEVIIEARHGEWRCIRVPSLQLALHIAPNGNIHAVTAMSEETLKRILRVTWKDNDDDDC